MNIANLKKVTVAPKEKITKPLNGKSRTFKKITVSSEIVYFAAIILLSLAVSLLTAANFGISMIVAPAYLFSLKSGFLTFGQAEYIIQAGLFVIFCLVMKKFKPVYLSSFITCLIYGAILDLWRCIPLFNPKVTAPGSMGLSLRIAMFIIGMLLTSFSVSLFYKTYLYPQVYDFFVKGVTEKYNLKLSVFKTCFDLFCLAASTVMSFVFFKKFVGIYWGTLVMTVFNGTLIGFFGNLTSRVFNIKPAFKNFALKFNIK